MFDFHFKNQSIIIQPHIKYMHRLYANAHKRLIKFLQYPNIDARNVEQMLGKFKIGAVSSQALFMLPKDQLRLLIKAPCPVVDPKKQQDTIHIGKRLRQLLNIEQKKVCRICPLRQQCHIARKTPKELNLSEMDIFVQTLLYTQILALYPHPQKIHDKHWMAGYKLMPSLINMIQILSTNKQEVQQYIEIKKSMTNHNPDAPQIQGQQQKNNSFSKIKEVQDEDINTKQTDNQKQERDRQRRMTKRQHFQEIPRNRISNIQFEQQRNKQSRFQTNNYQKNRGDRFDRDKRFDRQDRSFNRKPKSQYYQRQFDNRRDTRARSQRYGNNDNPNRFDSQNRFDKQNKFYKQSRFDKQNRFDQQGRFDNHNRFDKQSRYDNQNKFDRRPQRQYNKYEFNRNERYENDKKPYNNERNRVRDEHQQENPIIRNYNKKPKGNEAFKQKWDDKDDDLIVEDFFKQEIASKDFTRDSTKIRGNKQQRKEEKNQKPNRINEIKKNIIRDTIEQDNNQASSNQNVDRGLGRRIRRK